MGVIELLLKLKDNNIDLGLTGEDIEVHFDGLELPVGIPEEIREHKPAIVAFLKEIATGHGIAAFAQERPERIPLSYAQERLWFLDALSGSLSFHIPIVFRLAGPLDMERLAQSFRALIDRHEALRTVIRQQQGEAYQVLLPADGWVLDIPDAPGSPGADEGSLPLYIGRIVAAPFDLKKDFMLRAALIRMEEAGHVLVMVVHHIAADGWSLGILIRDLAALYKAYGEGRAARLRERKVQYADYALWQRHYMSGELLKRQLGYWKKRLDGVSPLVLPTDHQRPAVQRNRGEVHVFRIPGSLRDGLQELARGQRVTLFMTLLAAYLVLLQRYSGQDDICVGVPVAGRNQAELEDLIGLFINMLPLRCAVNPALSFRSLLEQVKEATLEAYEHQDAPFEKVVEMVVKERDISRTPLFQAAFTLQHHSHLPSLTLDETELVPAVFGARTSQFDMNFTMMEDPGGITAAVEYCTDLFTAETIGRMGVHYTVLLDSILEDIDQPIGALQLLHTAEKEQLLKSLHEPRAGYPRDLTVVDLFTDQADRRPEAIALIFEKERMCYRELDERSNRLAHYLRGLGVEEEKPVAICIDKCMEMIVAILAVLKAGGVYVPIDPGFPLHRIEYMLEDTAAALVLTSRDHLGSLPSLYTGKIVNIDEQWEEIAACEDSMPAIVIRPDNLAYIIYTSGSTGRPKGVMIEHRNIVRLFMTDSPIYDFNEGDVWTFFHSFCFDFSVWEIFGALLFGGRLVMVPRAVARDV